MINIIFFFFSMKVAIGAMMGWRVFCYHQESPILDLLSREKAARLVINEDGFQRRSRHSVMNAMIKFVSP